MTDQLEQELRDVLAGRAGDVGHPSFGGDAMVTRGRAARRRRQGMALAGTAAAVVAALIVGGTLLRPTHEALPPAERKPAPVDTKPAPVAETPFSLELVDGNDIVAPGGKRTRVNLPKGQQISEASRVPSGWVIESEAGAGPAGLWFLPVGGELRQLSTRDVSYAISVDGKRIAIAGDPDSVVALRELPSGRELARTTYEAPLGPLASAIVGDRVVLQEIQGGEGPTGPGIWDVRTGKVTRLTDNGLVGITELSADGTTAMSQARGVSQCAVFGSLDELVPANAHRFCEPSELFLSGKMSPGGRHLVAGTGAALMVADVQHTREQKRVVGRAVGIPKEAASARALLWENDDWLIVEVPSGARVTLLRCAVNGDPCKPLPGAFGFNAVVQRYGS